MSVISSGRTDSSSLPALTRASTALNSNQSNLPTPCDNASVFGRNPSSKIANVPVDLARIRQQSSSLGLSSSSIVAPSQSIPQESDTSYFPTPTVPSPHTPTRNRSTKELIKRYESMSAGSRSPSSVRSSSIQEERSSPVPMQRPISALKTKGRSPLRDSFMNLMTLFGKKNKGKDGETTTLGSPYEASVASTPPVVIHNSPRPDAILVEDSEDAPSHSGPVLYLSLPASGSALPVWTNCKASLLRDRIVLEWHTAFGNPASKVIILEKSADVHSLATSQVDATEKILLPNMGQDLHIFEITFVTGPPEKFALPSVAERTSWVSSIWDTLLHIGSNNAGERFPNSSLPSKSSGLVQVSDECHEEQEEPGSSTEVTAFAQQSSRISDSTVLDSNVKSVISPSELLSMPPTPTKSARLSNEDMSLKRCNPSVQSLDNVLLGQARLSRLSFAEKMSNLHEPAALSRCSTANSRYFAPSQRPSEPLTPSSLPRNSGKRGEAHPEVVPEANPKELVEDTIYDYYVQNNIEERKLPPLPLSSSVYPLNSDPIQAEDVFDPDGDSNTEQPYTLRDAPIRRSMLAQEQPQTLGDTVHPLVALIQDHAVQQYSQTSDLGHQIASLRNDVLTMSSELRVVINDQKPDSDLRRVLEELCLKMEKSTTPETPEMLRELNTKVDLIQSSLAQFSESSISGPEITTLRNLGNSGKEQDTKTMLRKLDEKIDQIQQDMKTPSNENDPLDQTALVDMKTDVTTRLNELISLVRNVQDKKEETKAIVEQVENTETEELADSAAESNDAVTSVSGPVNPAEKLQEILEILKEEKEQKKTSGEQQAENARYLQELNTWLETFVNNGTSQIQKIATGVDEIRKEFSPQSSELKDPAGHNSGLHSNIQELMATVKDNNEKTVTLQASLKEFIGSKTIAEEQKAPDMEVIIGIIEKQRAEQEHMLRSIATELSNDIRGERLRFVEAMKEATAINVQVHVEEFKKELSREVMAMTCEVGRLQRERQNLEQQIADLFAFFAKQRAEMEQASRVQVPPQQPPSRAATLRRPLPTPK